MATRVCVVTGASSGLGLAISIALARAGKRVVMVCRDKGRGEAALSAVRSNAAGDSTELAQADLSSQASIREFADWFANGYERLDVLVNNAATFTQKRSTTVDGLETMFATNHLGPFLLTNLLLDRLATGAPSRVINVTAPSTSKLDFDDLQGERQFSALTAFGRSKMCNLLFTYELARRLAGSVTTVNALHPGLMKTNLMNQAPALLRWPLGLISAAPDKSAAAVARLSLDPEFGSRTGQFFKGTTVGLSSAYSRDPAIQQRLWQVSERLTALDDDASR
jgi:NAD(P)-dependent dehydrogenase (short-subunit alcohol dehydrogenase family)